MSEPALWSLGLGWVILRPSPTKSAAMDVQKASVCPLDCPDTCSLTVTVVRDEVAAVRGSKANPVTNGAICAKVAKYYPDFVHGSSRLRHPLKRIGAKGEGKFEPVSWDQALEIVHSRVGDIIGRYGPQALLPLNYAGPHGMLAGDSMSLRFFHWRFAVEPSPAVWRHPRRSLRGHLRRSPRHTAATGESGQAHHRVG